MKAALATRYGGNETVEIRDIPKPACGTGDVLIRVRAAGVNPVDWKIRDGQLRLVTGFRFPKILGNECSGEVVDTGAEAAAKFKPGDPVIGWPGAGKLGAFAEYAVVRSSSVYPKPGGVTFEQAACIPIAGITALQGLRDKGQVAYGKQVLVNGASGGVGHLAVQIAKIFGAEVTGVSSGANADFIKSLGADRTIDYTREDFAQGEKRYDIVFDAVAKRSFSECRRILTRDGIYVSTLPSLPVVLTQLLPGSLVHRKAATIWVRPNAADVAWLGEYIATGRIRVVIERAFGLDQAREALAMSETGKVRGKLVLTPV